MKKEKHFLQTQAWADVRQALGHEPIWIGDSLMTIKPLPKPFKPFGYMPQVDLESLDFEQLQREAKQRGLSHVLLDPNDSEESFQISPEVQNKYSLKQTESIYYRHTLVLDLTKSEEELMAAMHKKHRYNIRVSDKHEVKVEVRDDEEALEVFLKLFFETVKRQGYFGRTPDYYRTIWRVLQPQGRVKIAIASYQGQPLVSWMIYLGDKTIYYPYGGSSTEHKNVMATNGLVWGLIKWGRAEGYAYLDLWGIDAPDTSQGQKSHGFSEFKIKFGGRQIHYLPAYVMVVDPIAFRIFKLSNSLRWALLNLRKLIS